LDAYLQSKQSHADNTGTASTVTWAQLQNSGININFGSFQERWKSEDALPPEKQELHKLVDRFDSRGLVIKTSTQADQQSQGQPKQQGSAMKTAALRATRAGDLA